MADVFRLEQSHAVNDPQPQTIFQKSIDPIPKGIILFVFSYARHEPATIRIIELQGAHRVRTGYDLDLIPDPVGFDILLRHSYPVVSQQAFRFVVSLRGMAGVDFVDYHQPLMYDIVVVVRISDVGFEVLCSPMIGPRIFSANVPFPTPCILEISSNP